MWHFLSQSTFLTTFLCYYCCKIIAMKKKVSYGRNKMQLLCSIFVMQQKVYCFWVFLYNMVNSVISLFILTESHSYLTCYVSSRQVGGGGGYPSFASTEKTFLYFNTIPLSPPLINYFDII